MDTCFLSPDHGAGTIAALLSSHYVYFPKQHFVDEDTEARRRQSSGPLVRS